VHRMSDIKFAQFFCYVSPVWVFRQLLQLLIKPLKQKLLILHNQSITFQRAPFNNTPFTPLFLVL